MCVRVCVFVCVCVCVYIHEEACFTCEAVQYAQRIRLLCPSTRDSLYMCAMTLFVCIRILMDTGIRFILTAGTVEGLVRSTVALMFIMQVCVCVFVCVCCSLGMSFISSTRVLYKCFIYVFCMESTLLVATILS